MQTEITPLPAAPKELSSPRPAAWPRLWPPLLFVALYWAGRIAVDRVEKPYFYGFLYTMASAALLALVFFGWWWTRRSVRLFDRLLGFLCVVVGGLIVAPFCHSSVFGFGLMFGGLPVALTVWTLWMVVAKLFSFSLNGAGALAVVWLAWSSFTLIRVDGLDADLRADYRWRWAPTAEDLFRAELAARANEASPPADTRPLSAGPGDWVAFRGPARDGVIRGVTITADWSTNPPRQLWRQRVGPAWSSVLVVGDRLFTQEQRDDKETVVCYDARTGKQRWLHEDTARFEESVSGAGPRATPTFADGRLFTLGATGLLNCLDAATGKPHWPARDITKDAGATPPRWGLSGSPLVVDGLVIVYAGGGAGKDLLAYRVRTGELAWGAPVGQDSYSSPQLTLIDGKRQVLFLTDRGLKAVEPATGELLWEHGLSMPGAPRTVQAHALSPTQLVVGTLAGPGVARIDVARYGGSWKTTERWATTDLKPEFPDFVVHAGHAYGLDSGTFCCIELESGTRRWRGGRYGRGQVMLLADQPALLVLTEKGEAVLLAANPERREELGRFRALGGSARLKGKTWNHPVIAHGRLYVRNAEEMACYDLSAK
jgi:outer membrane protein assembly factor BamB